MKYYLLEFEIYSHYLGKYHIPTPSKEKSFIIYQSNERNEFIEDFEKRTKNDINYENVKGFFVNTDIVSIISLDIDKINEMKNSY